MKLAASRAIEFYRSSPQHLENESPWLQNNGRIKRLASGYWLKSLECFVRRVGNDGSIIPSWLQEHLTSFLFRFLYAQFASKSAPP